MTVLNQLSEVAKRNLPILCIDTCSLLDLSRDPCRKGADDKLIVHAKEILDAITAKHFAELFIAQQVVEELKANRQKVVDDANQSLSRIKATMQQLDNWAHAFGAKDRVDLSHLSGHIATADQMIDKMLNEAIQLGTHDKIAGLAHTRVMEPRTPAKIGKDSFKDCLVIETYLEAVQQLRANGHTSPVIFLSSNVKEFVTSPSTELNSDLKMEFEDLGISYARAMHEASFRLGLNEAKFENLTN